MSKSRQTCCIKGCSNTRTNRKNRVPPVSFYSFPSASIHAPWRMEKRKLWINAIQKHSKHNKDWEPSSTAKICSVHFVNNTKVEHPLHPSYLPTIFPDVESKDWQQILSRFHRQQNRSNAENIINNKTLDAQEINKDIKTEVIDEEPLIIVEPTNLMYDVGCQTDFIEKFENACPETSFLCIMKQKDGICTAQLQINIVAKEFADKSSSADMPIMKYHRDVAVDATLPMLNGIGFQGMSSVKNDNELTNLTGISLASFNYLLKLMPDNRTAKLSKQNKLLLTLMKLKTGMDFSALGVLFDIHRTSVYRTFITVLDCLHGILKNFISWPSREVVKSTLPDAFKKHYPNTRVITECIKIKTQVPSDIKDQEITYSQYKNNHTVKFLVGSTPNGLISFVSKCYSGMASDLFITRDSGLLDLLEPGDVVMTKKGSPTIRTDVRSHIEKFNQRIRDFLILSKLSTTLLPYMDRIALVTCALLNSKPSIVLQKN